MLIAHDAPGPKALLQIVRIIAQFNKRSSDPRRPTKTTGNNHQSDALSTIVPGFPNFAFDIFRAFAHGVSKG
jgi:hypothetical protein